MNFTEFKKLTPSDRITLLGKTFYEKHGVGYLNKLIRKRGIEIEEWERRVLVTTVLMFCIKSRLEDFDSAVPWSDLAVGDNLSLEIIYYFKKFSPYVFGFNDGVRAVEGLVSITHRQFAGGFNQLIIYLTCSDLRNVTVPQIVNHLSSQGIFHIDEKAIDNCIRRDF